MFENLCRNRNIPPCHRIFQIPIKVAVKIRESLLIARFRTRPNVLVSYQSLALNFSRRPIAARTLLCRPRSSHELCTVQHVLSLSACEANLRTVLDTLTMFHFREDKQSKDEKVSRSRMSSIFDIIHTRTHYPADI